MIRSYKQPQTIEEAVALKKEQPDADYFAGGTCINHADCTQTYTHVISLDKLGLDSIEIVDGVVRIGSMTTFQNLVDSPLIMPVVKDAARAIYSRNVRNMATIGGNLASCWTHSAMIPALTALKSVIELSTKEDLPIEEFLDSQSEALITAVKIPLSNRACSVKRVRRSSGSKTLLSFAVSLELSEDGMCIDPIVIATGFAEVPVRLSEIETLLTKRKEHSVFEFDLAFRAMKELSTDEHSSKAYKTYISARTVVACAEQCKEVLA